MRGRTNVLSFNEDFINADTIEATVAPNNSVVSGNFVNFYNAIDGGFEVTGYFHIVKKLSDGRLMCVGLKQNATKKWYYNIVILERTSSGRFVQNLPEFVTDIGGNTTYIYDNGRIIDVDSDTVAFVYLVGNNTTSTAKPILTFRLTYLNFDTNLNQINSTTVDKVTDIASKLKFGADPQPSYIYKFKPYEYYVDFVKIDNNIYFIFDSQFAWDTSSSSSSTNLTNVRALVSISITLQENYNYIYNGGRIINQLGFGFTSATYTPKPIYITYSDSGKGIFALNYASIGYRAEDNCLYFIPLADFVNDNLLPEVITFQNKFNSSYLQICPFVTYGDFVYFIFAGAPGGTGLSEVFWFKIYFYNYTRTGYSYLMYDPVSLGFRTKAREKSPYKNYFNYTLLYANDDIIRTFFSFCYSGDSSWKTLLLDIDKNTTDIIINPPINVPVGVSGVGNKLFIVYYPENNSFVVIETAIYSDSGYLREYKIINDSELSGVLQNMQYVENATDENYIMGIAKESGNPGETILCYKAKTS